ncbi:hypothetical protein Q3G72_022402 [Acer saccharum]|nr:hypothetical protein Q3G72_022402 [Acer saccharum]
MRSSNNCYCHEARVVSCNLYKDVQIELWHKRLGHMNYRDLRILDKFNVVRGLPQLGKKVNGVCGPCQQGKQTKSMHKKGKYLSTKEPLKLLHKDFMGLMQTESLGGKRYICVCVDDFSSYTWTYFLREKSETFDKLKMLCTKLQNEKDSNIKSIKRIRSDHGREFDLRLLSSLSNSQCCPQSPLKFFSDQLPLLLRPTPTAFPTSSYSPTASVSVLHTAASPSNGFNSSSLQISFSSSSKLNM